MDCLWRIVLIGIVLNGLALARGRGSYRPRHFIATEPHHQDRSAHIEETRGHYRPHHQTKAKGADASESHDATKYLPTKGQIDNGGSPAGAALGHQILNSQNSIPKGAVNSGPEVLDQIPNEIVQSSPYEPSRAATLTEAEAEALVESEAAAELQILMDELEHLVGLDRIQVGLNSLANLEVVGKRSIEGAEEPKARGIRRLIRKQRAACSDCEYCKYCKFCAKCPCDDVEGCKHCDQCENCKYCKDSVCCFPCLWTSLC